MIISVLGEYRCDTNEMPPEEFLVLRAAFLISDKVTWCLPVLRFALWCRGNDVAS